MKKLLRSWVGLRVRFLRDTWNGRGLLFAAGIEGTVISVYRGLRIHTDDGRFISQIPREYVEVVPSRTEEVASP
jgi:hypothetical protein